MSELALRQRKRNNIIIFGLPETSAELSKQMLRCSMGKSVQSFKKLAFQNHQMGCCPGFGLEKLILKSEGQLLSGLPYLK